MNISKRRIWIVGAIALGAIILVTLLLAPSHNRLTSGSTYNRAPEGYGAWYAFMTERGTPIQRWRKPFEELVNKTTGQQPVTLLQVNSSLMPPQFFSAQRGWVAKGNTLVVLGVWQPVTAAPFRTTHQVGTQRVTIDTQRRADKVKGQRLGDRFGAIVWQEKIGNGQIIYATTPHLAANAYQDFQGNYEFLAQLVTQPTDEQKSKIQNFVWVDEYIHGYKDAEVIKREQKENVLSYLAKTPLFPTFIQGLILLLVAIWAGNRRFGKPLTLSTPTVDNSEAYIHALAGVLQKANSSEFVLDIVGKAEQLQLQKALYLGQEQLDDQSLINAWVQQTGRPAVELEQLLQMPARKRRISETELLTWLDKWAKIRRHLPSSKTDS